MKLKFVMLIIVKAGKQGGEREKQNMSSVQRNVQKNEVVAFFFIAIVVKSLVLYHKLVCFPYKVD